MISYENKSVVDNLSLNHKILAFKMLKKALNSGQLTLSQEREIKNILDYLESTLIRGGAGIPTNYNLSDSEMQEAENVMEKIENRQRYEYKEESFTDKLGAFFFGTVFVCWIVYGIIHGLASGISWLWQKGILQIILAGTAIGTITYFGKKKGWFNKIKEKSNSVKKSNVKPIEKENVEALTKEKELTSNIKNTVKNLAIYAGIITIMETGLANLNKNTNVFNDTIIGDFLDNSEIVYDGTRLHARRLFYKIFNNDYFDNMIRNSYDYVNNNYLSANCDDFLKQNNDKKVYARVNDANSWREISKCWYGDSNYADYLQYYNSRNVFIGSHDTVVVPNIEDLVEYGNKLLKK